MFYSLLLLDDENHLAAGTMLTVEHSDRLVLAAPSDDGPGMRVLYILRNRVADFLRGLQVPAVLSDGARDRIVEVALA